MWMGTQNLLPQAEIGISIDLLDGKQCRIRQIIGMFPTA